MSERSCLCGCGASLEGMRSHAKYANGACRARASAAKTQSAVSGEPDALVWLVCSMAFALGVLIGIAVT